MNLEETAKLIGTAMMAYPRWLEKADEEALGAMTVAWHRMLGDLDYQLADAALAKHAATSQYPPTIAEIRSAALSLTPSELPDGEDAWAEVLQAMQKVGYMGTPEWSHPVIAKCVAAMWGNWRNACGAVMTETLGVDRAQFLRMFQTMTKRERDELLLPAPVREIAGLLADKFRAPTALKPPNHNP